MRFADKTSITVPARLARTVVVSGALAAITKKVGGCTSTDAHGTWQDTEGKWIIEPVVVYTWYFNRVDCQCQVEIEALCKILFEYGEQSVMIEHNGQAGDVNAFIIYPRDLQ
jgi:hypothetical protein